MLDPQQSGGGALRNLGVHGVDAFLSLAGEQAVRVDHAAFHSIFGEAVEDYACVVLRAADGMVGVIEAGYTHPDAGGTYELRINAEGGALVDTGSHVTATPHRAIDRNGLCAVQPSATADSSPTRWNACAPDARRRFLWGNSRERQT